ncbi:unnamed protein product, partial [Ilex paraguariensis]
DLNETFIVGDIDETYRQLVQCVMSAWRKAISIGYVLILKLEDGDILNVDVIVYYKVVHGDLNGTFFVGDIDETYQQPVHCTYECLEKAMSI